VDFVKTFRFERLGVFAYSEEDGTPAASMDEQVPLEVREARRDEIMSLQQDIAEVRFLRFTDCDSSFSLSSRPYFGRRRHTWNPRAALRARARAGEVGFFEERFSPP